MKLKSHQHAYQDNSSVQRAVANALILVNHRNHQPKAVPRDSNGVLKSVHVNVRMNHHVLDVKPIDSGIMLNVDACAAIFLIVPPIHTFSHLIHVLANVLNNLLKDHALHLNSLIILIADANVKHRHQLEDVVR